MWEHADILYFSMNHLKIYLRHHFKKRIKQNYHTDKRQIFCIGCKGIPAEYGGFETFMENLTLYKKSDKIRYHVASISNEDSRYEYNGAKCYNVKVSEIGPAKTIVYDAKALSRAIRYCEGRPVVISNNKDIVLTGYVPKCDLVELLNEAKGFAYPSYFEGFGIPPLEALSCGTPVAVSDIDVMREVLGDVVIYFDPYDEKDIASALKRLITEDKTPQIKRIDINTWGQSAEQLKKVYTKIDNGG